MYYEMAPREGITTYIYRRAHFHYFGGIDRYYTPFISTHKDKVMSHKELQEILPEHNEGMQVIPQILTSSAQEFVKMAKELAQMGYTEVNLNCGCPSATVTTKHKGAGVLENPKQLDQMLAEIFEKCPIQVSIKTRIGMEQDWEWEDILEVYSHYPIAELIIHPRVRQDFYKNTPRLEPVKAALDKLQCPVSYNGDLFCVGDVKRVSEQLPGLQACMLGRGLIADPGLVLTIRNGANINKDTLRDFHDEILEEYSRVLSGEKNAMYRMKELWFYMSQLFTEPDKYRKKIQKAEKLAVYESVVNRLFAEQELVDPDCNRFTF